MSQPVGTTVALPRGAAAHLLDYALPCLMLLALMVVLAPVPPAVVDVLLAANLTVSVLALLGALAARTPLDMSVFPTFLLGSTLIRLVLNIATTRLVLSRAAIDGVEAAGNVVQAFGEFVAANNIVVGGVIFAIIAVIQFVVITAGSTRTSEVAARFALDGLPGRQMAIDAEVQAGSITREEARRMRQDLQRHADFFASMDGASRFVRGEAVASVIITAVNIVGGLAIGVVQHGMPIPRAIDVYSRLTIGDGLVSAVPSLLISVATGLLISRSSQTVDLSREMGRQFASRPHILAIAAVFLGLLALTGLPFVPLAVMAVAVATTAWLTSRSARRSPVTERPAAVNERPEVKTAEKTDDLFADERIVVEVGRGLVSLIAGGTGHLMPRTTALRSQLAADLGLVVPAITMRDDLTLPERGYRVTVAGERAIEGELPPGRLLAIPAPGQTLGAGHPGCDGVDEDQTVIEPLSGRRGTWLGHAQAESVRRHGATILDEVECVVRGVEIAIRRHADALLSRDAVARLVESLRAVQPAVVEQSVTGALTIARIHRTLQCLLRDGVPIRPLGELLEIMADHAEETAEPVRLAEVVRRALVRSICRRVRDHQGRLVAVRLEQPAVDALLQGGVASPQVVADVRRAMRPGIDRGARPVAAVPGEFRVRVREVLSRHLPDLRVLATEELADQDRVDVFATIGGGQAARAA